MNINSANLELAVRLGGVLQLGVLTASALVPRKLEWRRQLRPLDPLLRQLVWTYGAFIVLIIAALGALSLGMSETLVGGTPLARCVTGFIAAFWSIRLTLQFFVFDVKPYLTNRLYALGYHSLTVAFLYLAVVFTWVTIRG
ncbi:MAG: hypothetical protein K8U03_09625 [Planctomycetia bacterium]|nr:hypothetical protein [Planctomycetia bacterium]